MKEPKPQEAVIYCRVSSAKQVREGHGLTSQETRCREFAVHKGYDVTAVFRDEGVSGGLIDRPGMLAMLAHLKKHSRVSPTVVLIDDITRLARDIQAHIQLRTAIQSAGGKLESPSIEFGSNSDSILVENLLASVSQHARQKNTEQVINRMRARVMNGYWVFSPPVGYRFEKVSGHGSMLVPDEPAAGLVREALEGFASGRFESQAEVRRHLETFPAFPRSRHGEVPFKIVEQMLKRPLYAGYMNVDKWDIRLHPAKHQPLISFETWRRVQDRLNGKPVAPIRKDTNADFPLRGFVACACCGKPMTASWSKGRSARYPYYFCQQRTCRERRKNIRGDRMEAEFEALLRELQPTRELFTTAYQMLRDLWEERMGGAHQRTKDIRAEVTRIGHQSAQLMDRIMLADRPSLIAAYEERLHQLEEEKLLLLERARRNGQPRRTFEQTYRTAFAFLADPWKLWVSDHLEHKRMVLRLVFGGKIAYSRLEGYRTAIPALLFKALTPPNGLEGLLVEPKGIEPSTSRVRF